MFAHSLTVLPLKASRKRNSLAPDGGIAAAAGRSHGSLERAPHGLGFFPNPKDENEERLGKVNFARHGPVRMA